MRNIFTVCGANFSLGAFGGPIKPPNGTEYDAVIPIIRLPMLIGHLLRWSRGPATMVVVVRGFSFL